MPLEAELGGTRGVVGHPLKSGIPPTVLKAMSWSDDCTDFVIKDLEEVEGGSAQPKPQGEGA